jgi:hypothetical protein
MTDEQREINRRVALALGGTKIAFYPSEGWYWNPPGSEVFYPMPNFCNDPAAADLVRIEIERRGWLWAFGIAHDGSWGCVNVPLPDSEFNRSNFRQFFRNDVTPTVSLLSAFLAACEAEENTT